MAPRVLTVCLITTVGSVLPLFLAATLGVELQMAFGLNEAGFGAMISVYHLSGALLGAPLGRQIDNIGWPAGVRLSALAGTISLGGVALLARSPIWLGVFLAIGGMGHATTMSSVNLAIIREVPPYRLGIVFGVKQAAPTAGFLLSGLSLPWLALTLGWRFAFLAGSVLTLTGMALATGQWFAPNSHPEPSVAPSSVRGEGTVRLPATALLALAGGVAAMSVSALASFMIISNVAAGMAPSTAGMLVAACSVVGIATRVCAGLLIDRRPSNGLRLTAALLVLGSLGYLLLATGRIGWLTLGSFVAFGAGWGWPGLYHFAIVSTNAEAPAAATGIAHAAISTGSAVGPIGFGLLVEHGSFQLAWTAVAIAAAVAGFLILGAHHTLRSGAKDPNTTPGRMVHSRDQPSAPWVDPPTAG